MWRNIRSFAVSNASRVPVPFSLWPILILRSGKSVLCANTPTVYRFSFLDQSRGKKGKVGRWERKYFVNSTDRVFEWDPLAIHICSKLRVAKLFFECPHSFSEHGAMCSLWRVTVSRIVEGNSPFCTLTRASRRGENSSWYLARRERFKERFLKFIQAVRMGGALSSLRDDSFVVRRICQRGLKNVRRCRTEGGNEGREISGRHVKSRYREIVLGNPPTLAISSDLPRLRLFTPVNS